MFVFHSVYEVPISILSSTKKVKSLSTNNNFIVQALRSSSRLVSSVVEHSVLYSLLIIDQYLVPKVVSSDGKRVRRKVPFTDKDKEELLVRSAIVQIMQNISF